MSSSSLCRRPLSDLQPPIRSSFAYDYHNQQHRLGQTVYERQTPRPSPLHTLSERPLAHYPHNLVTDVITANATGRMHHLDLQSSRSRSYSPHHPQHHTPAVSSSESHIPRSVQLAQPAPAWMQTSGTDRNSVGSLGNIAVDGLKRQYGHQRASSTSTIASTSPASPHDRSVYNPHIANTDQPPFEYSFDFTKQTFNSQPVNPALLSTSYLPPQYSRVQRFDFQDPPLYPYSMSTSDRASSNTPSSVAEESESRSQRRLLRNGEMAHGENRPLPHSHLQLNRTESAAYQDELYNPANFTSAPTVKPTKPQVQTQRTLVSQYLESANMARSVSPISVVPRDKSPYREGSDQVPSDAWSSPHNPIQTQASRRRQIKEEREQAELAAHRPQLNREPTKTVSPKEYVLDYNETDQPPLIQDVIPAGYQQHLGGTEPYADVAATTLARQNPALVSAAFQNNAAKMAGFRPTSGDAFTTAQYAFSPPGSQTTAAMQQYQLAGYPNLGQMDATYATGLLDATPQFPAQLTSMESSMSEGPPLSSQEGNLTVIARPADTRSNAGAYACAESGCLQRFDSSTLLQRHKREQHSSAQRHVRDAVSTEPSSAGSPRSTASPGPAGSGLTSAQILARNSQAGPHKCTRTNPSTGKPCNTIFSRPYDLTRHEETIHNGRKHKVRCPYCREEKTFSRNDALTRHMRVVHPDVDSAGKRGRRGD